MIQKLRRSQEKAAGYIENKQKQIKQTVENTASRLRLSRKFCNESVISERQGKQSKQRYMIPEHIARPDQISHEQRTARPADHTDEKDQKAVCDPVSPCRQHKQQHENIAKKCNTRNISISSHLFISIRTFLAAPASESVPQVLYVTDSYAGVFFHIFHYKHQNFRISIW